MKKTLALLLSLMMIFALCACKKAESEDAHNHDHNHTTEAVQTEGTEAPDTTEPVVSATEDTTSSLQSATDSVSGSDKVDTEGQYKQKHINKIDVPCAEEINKAQSDASKKVIYERYAEEWTEVGDRYYNELLKIKGSVHATANYNTAEQMHEYLQFYKQDWDLNFAQQTKVFVDQMVEGADNTGVELMVSQLTYESKRELALYFIGIYEDIEEFSNQGY